MSKELILAKYRTVEEMAILAKSLSSAAHYEAAAEVVSRLQGLVEGFKDELASAFDVAEVVEAAEAPLLEAVEVVAIQTAEVEEIQA